MKILNPWGTKLVTLSVISLALAGCAVAPTIPLGAADARQQLLQLQSDRQLAVLVPLAIKEAEQAVLIAEQPERDIQLARHRVAMAERKVAMAATVAQTRLLESQRQALSQQRDDVRLNARTQEANRARADARDAREDAEQARLRADEAQVDATGARSDAAQAKRKAMLAANREQIALSDARSARQKVQAADEETDLLRKQLEELNARPTDRGLVITLGDVLFDSGKHSLKDGISSHLDKLALFLNNYPQRHAQIEGHTDDVGSEINNMLLSQRRAETVKDFLQSKGVAGSRLDASGKGESAPLATNNTAYGRQLNRRVEVIIAEATPIAQR